MTSFIPKTPLIALAASTLMAGSVWAAGPAGFEAVPVASPQGFDTPTMTVAQVKADAKDKAVVRLEGRFIERLEKDKYLFQDRAGETIAAELDDDKNWSHVAKDRVMRVTAEVDRDWNGVEIDVIEAK